MSATVRVPEVGGTTLFIIMLAPVNVCMCVCGGGGGVEKYMIT